MHTFRKLLFLLAPNERKSAALLLVLIFMMALIDMIGVASILPFMAVLTNPTLIETNSILNDMYQISSLFGIENIQQFLFALGVLVFVTLIISLTFKVITTYAQVRFIQMREYSIGKRLIEGYLHQPYSWFLNRHSADLGKTILSEVQLVANNGLRSLIELIAKGLVATALIYLIIIVNPKLAFIVSFSLAGAYCLIFYFTRGYLTLIGKKSLKNNQLRFKVVNEAFGAAKEVKVGGLEQAYIESFSSSAQTFAKTQASLQAIGQIPRFILEAIAFGGILLILLYIMRQTGNFNDALPILSLYVFAGYRILRALLTFYQSFSQLTFIGPSQKRLCDDLNGLKSFKKNLDQGILVFDNKINLKNINYNYPNASRTALKNISLNISAKSTVGFVGTTGSGKTTIVDVIMGLLEPQKGTLDVDEKIITNQNLRSWQRCIGYVPQHIYLSDNTIASNIAFGVELKDINYETIEKVSKIANLHYFVKNELPEQYQTIIGERGVRLSGGQRQRIGIARALYHNPKVLILDEATSALDNLTEEAVMGAVNNLSKSITIILIAHRLNTMKICDIIYKIDKGEIHSQGTYKELFEEK